MAIKREKHIIDAADQVLGRLATKVATLLRGKHRPDYVPNKDSGDFVVIQNVSKLRVTGQKLTDKTYFWHTGYIGGIKERSLAEMNAKNPSRAFKLAVFGMLPKNKLRPYQLRRLKFE